jgi:DNA gyrase subunit A
MIFTTQGHVYKLRVSRNPGCNGGRSREGDRQSDQSPGGRHIAGVVPVRQFAEGQYVVMVTRQGVIKKTELSEFANIRANGIIAMGVDEEDELMAVELTNGEKKIFLATRRGLAICFEESQVRDTGRAARGVRAHYSA